MTGKMEEMWKNGSEWIIGTDGGLKENIGTIGVFINESTTMEEIVRN